MIEKILPDVYRIEVPLPNSPLKAINSYLLMSEGRNLVIDTAFNQQECLEVLSRAYGELGVDLNRTDFLSTHLHVDHMGLIGKLARPEAKKYMNSVDSDFLKENRDWSKLIKITSMAGFSPEKLPFVGKNHPMQKFKPDRSVEWSDIKEGDSIVVGDYALTCLETPGHTPGHICLYEAQKKLLFAGDHILGNITPNIQVWDFDDDPLASYMASLDKIAALDISLVFPAHRSVVRDCGTRIEELKRHHLNRCNEVLDILRSGARNAERTASRMTWEITAESWDCFSALQQWFATGEAVAHLRFLTNRGFVVQEIQQRTGEILYSPTAKESRLESMD